MICTGRHAHMVTYCSTGAGNVDPEVVGVEEVIVQPCLQCVPVSQVLLNSLNHTPDLHATRQHSASQ